MSTKDGRLTPLELRSMEFINELLLKFLYIGIECKGKNNGRESIPFLFRKSINSFLVKGALSFMRTEKSQ